MDSPDNLGPAQQLCHLQQISTNMDEHDTPQQHADCFPEPILISGQHAKQQQQQQQPSSASAAGDPEDVHGHGNCQQQRASFGAQSMSWQHCSDYCNGGPGFYMTGSAGLPQIHDAHQHMAAGHASCGPTCTHAKDKEQEQAGMRALAFFDDYPGTAAAVQCRVGSGVAVLCATHPELAPRWLLPACNCHQRPPASDSTVHILHETGEALYRCMLLGKW